MGAGGGQVLRGPDDKMYVANNGATSLATVSTPDATPSFNLTGQTLSAKTSNFGLPQTVGNCTKAFPDTDSDGVNDVVDLDDDNDGILDIIEVCDFVSLSKTGVTVTSSMSWPGGALATLVDGSDVANQTYPAGAAIANQTFLQFDLPTARVVNTIELGCYPGQTPLAAGAVYKLQAFDGLAWADIVASQTFNGTTAPIKASQNSIKFDMMSNAIAYTK